MCKHGAFFNNILFEQKDNLLIKLLLKSIAKNNRKDTLNDLHKSFDTLNRGTL